MKRLKRYTRTLIAILPWLPMPAAGQTAEVVTFPGAGIEVAIPAGFRRQGDPELKEPFAAFDLRSGAILIVAAPPVTPPMAPILAGEQARLIESASSNGRTLLLSRSTRLAGVPAFLVFFKEANGTYVTRYYIIANDRKISFSFMAPQEVLAENHPVFSQTLTTIRFSQPPRLPRAQLSDSPLWEGLIFNLGRFSGLLAPLAVALYVIFRSRKRPKPAS